MFKNYDNLIDIIDDFELVKDVALNLKDLTNMKKMKVISILRTLSKARSLVLHDSIGKLEAQFNDWKNWFITH